MALHEALGRVHLSPCGAMASAASHCEKDCRHDDGGACRSDGHIIWRFAHKSGIVFLFRDCIQTAKVMFFQIMME